MFLHNCVINFYADVITALVKLMQLSHISPTLQCTCVSAVITTSVSLCVYPQLKECIKSILGFEEFVTSCVGQSPRRQETGSVHYSEEEITYAFFVHSLSMIERVLLYKESWKLFPIRVDTMEG